MDGSARSSLGCGSPERQTAAGRGLVGSSLRRLFGTAALGSLLLLVASAAAGAGTIRLSPPAPPEPRVGAVWHLKIQVVPEDGDQQETTATITLNATGGQRIDVIPQRTGEGVYEADVAFPAPGNWTYVASSGGSPSETRTITIGSAESSDSTWKLATLVASGIALLAVAALLLTRRRPPAASPRVDERPGAELALAPAREPQPPPPREPRSPPPPPASDEAQEDREALIRSCVYLYDIVREQALRDRLRDALAEAGVTELDSVGGQFDPGKHKATGRVPTDNPSLDGRIAEVERPGFSDRGRVFRLPEVTVYSSTGRESRG
jgi:molecular chaperone GrpE